MAGGGIALLTIADVVGTEDIFGRTMTDVNDITIASGTYPANGYTLDPTKLGQLNRFKTITEVYFSPKTVATLGIVWFYDIVNKSMRGYQNGPTVFVPGALVELTGTVGPFQLRCRFFGL